MATIFFGDYMIDGAKYDKFSKIRQLTRAEFDAIVDKDPDTLYVITDEENSGGSKPKVTTVTLTAAGWDSTTNTQTVSASGVLSNETAQLI